MLEALLDWPLQWERFALTPRRIYAVDDEWVLTVALHQGRARIGLDVEAEIVWAVRWQHGLITCWETYLTVEAGSRRPAGHAARGSPGSARPWPSTRRRGPGRPEHAEEID